MKDFIIKHKGKIYEFRLFEGGGLWYKDDLGAWTTANQVRPILDVSAAKLIATKMLLSAGL